jgi:hypothetical protein
MNYKMIDLLDKVVDPDKELDNELLIKEGVISSDGKIELTKINLMTGAFTFAMMDLIEEVDMDQVELLNYIENLYNKNQYMGIYYFLLYLFEALEMEVPYLFMQLPSNTQVLKYYINEFIADMKDYCEC